MRRLRCDGADRVDRDRGVTHAAGGASTRGRPTPVPGGRRSGAPAVSWSAQGRRRVFGGADVLSVSTARRLERLELDGLRGDALRQLLWPILLLGWFLSLATTRSTAL